MAVNDLSKAYKEHAPDWQLIRDVIEGSKAIRKGGEKYLPMLGGMRYKEYEAYSNRAQFFNATARTVNGLVGAVFRREPKINLGDAESLRPLLDSCTTTNQSFNAFARDIFRETLSMGRVGALVDAPFNGGTPYFTKYRAEDITNWRVVKMDDGKIMADQVVLCEMRAVPAEDGFGADEEKFYRVLFLDDEGRYHQEVFVKVETLEGKTNYVSVGKVMPMISGLGAFRNEMPFVCFGPTATGMAIQKSPILDIAELNVLHFQRSAQLAHGQFYTATPTYWAMAPMNGEQNVVYQVGPNNVWLVDQPNACGILEYRGEGLKYLESACTQLEQQMSGLGARLVSDRKNTAAEASDVAAMRDKGETSLLHEIVSSVDAGLTELLKVWVRWQGRNPKDVSVRLNRDFTGAALEYRLWLQLDRAHERGDIDDETYYQVLFEGEMLPASFGPQDIPALIKKAQANRARIKAEAEAAELRKIEAKKAPAKEVEEPEDDEEDDEEESK